MVLEWSDNPSDNVSGTKAWPKSARRAVVVTNLAILFGISGTSATTPAF